MCWSQTLLADASSRLRDDEHKVEQLKFQIGIKEKRFLVIGRTVTVKQAECGCSIAIPVGLQDYADRCPKESDLTRPVLNRMLYWIYYRDHFQLKFFNYLVVVMSASVPSTPALSASASLSEPACILMSRSQSHCCFVVNMETFSGLDIVEQPYYKML